MNPTDVVGRRVGAFIIDGIISSALSFGALYATTTASTTICALTPEEDAWQGVGTELFGGDCRFWESGGAFAAYLAIVVIGSFVLFWALPALKGVTPGKAMLGIRIIRNNGDNPGFGRVFVRGLMWIVDAFPYIIPYLTGFIVALNDKNEHRRLGDRVAGTVVIDKNAFGQYIPEQASPQQFQQQGYGTSPQAFNAGPPPPGQPPPPTPAAAGPAPGWYDDPQGEARLRYWDGSTWTSHTAA